MCIGECVCLRTCELAIISSVKYLIVLLQLTSEAEQLAWAKRDSQQEWERQKRLRDQEQADLERAIALSKQ